MEEQPPQIRLGRHGETEWRRTGRHTGRTDVALTAAGVLILIIAASIAVSGRQAAERPLDAAALAARVKAEFLHAWRGYTQYAWGHDELLPLSHKARDWYQDQPLYMTPVDALDTMLLMGLKDEADETRAYLADHLSFDKDIWVKNFEITIRMLGGLLSAYQMTGDARLLAKAEDLGRRLLPAFDSPTGMPYMYVNLATGRTGGPEMGPPESRPKTKMPRGASNPAEIGTLILEFGTLARLTHQPVFYERPKKALIALYARRAETGLVGDEIDVETGQWLGRTSHIGGGIDSFYEYLIKCERLFDDEDCGKISSGRRSSSRPTTCSTSRTTRGTWRWAGRSSRTSCATAGPTAATPSSRAS